MFLKCHSPQQMIARNNDIFGYQKQKTAYTVSIDTVYTVYLLLVAKNIIVSGYLI